MDTLERMAHLERAYDGPIPEPLKFLARHGCGARVEYLSALGNRAFFREMVQKQARTIRMRREDGSFYPALIEDLHYYRRRHREYCAAARYWLSQMAPPSAIAAE